MAVLQIVELVAVGVLMLVHVIANFYNARCTCKLCTMARQFFGKEETVSPTADYELFKQFVAWLEEKKEV